MARQSLSPMKNLDYPGDRAQIPGGDRVGRKRKDAPITHLKYLRKKSGYTLEMLADITSISISYLSRLESGSRRLNTDLIKRLSHAFGCDPSELLQENWHENQSVTPLEFSRKRRVDLFAKENSLHLYHITKSDEDTSKLEIKMCSPTEWKLRPTELQNRLEAFAVKAESYFKPYFNETTTLYLEPAQGLSPESTVVLMSGGKVSIKKIWSVTPTKLQLCEIDEIETLKKPDAFHKDKLTEIDRSSLDALYKVVGYSEFLVN